MEKTDALQAKTAVAVPARRGLPLWVTLLAFGLLIGFLALIAMGMRRNQAGPVVVGQAVPPIILNTFDGQVINTTDLKGKVILINFWASWCKTCEAEAVDLETAWQQYKPGGKVLFLGADYVDTEPEALGYLKKFGITYPNGPDLGTKISQTFRIRAVPETYVIDTNGKLAYIKIGPFESVQEITNAIDPLIP